jgi:hypothetical protein
LDAVDDGEAPDKFDPRKPPVASEIKLPTAVVGNDGLPPDPELDPPPPPHAATSIATRLMVANVLATSLSFFSKIANLHLYRKYC